MNKTTGIHHISSMVNDAQRTIDFYAGVLGLRLVKKTINFDRPEVYHLYFGNELGNPGTIITFFPWEKQLKGRVGSGQVGSTTYRVPVGSLLFWENRLNQFGVEATTSIRFGERYLQFSDPDGLRLELTERDEGPRNEWSHGGVEPENAIKGFDGAVLLSRQPHKTTDVLENILGLTCIGQENDYLRFFSEGELGNTIDIQLNPSVRGLMGAGIVHHLAWSAKDEEQLLKWREILQDKGYNPTEIRERNYFKAVYFHEEGGILFEIATDPPGFTVDEDLSSLGEALMLPPWLEPQRDELEALLPPVKVRVLEGDKK
ncbi:ring-cleaving dioxygenase [Bacillus sp. FJAT-27225]|uniref:ring-cleaving dioxygenase n=1 Tax=Bacillus sp. FJAT-27225 TaxID=1743144 RepID=UPI00080C358D|nr:ring-cleaving dioxygenase [Bacillus sp. FJAT-27225]OCA84132.1 ring-cleaving dioxygenase [Bacillus sp. FJAT-27225]